MNGSSMNLSISFYGGKHTDLKSWTEIVPGFDLDLAVWLDLIWIWSQYYIIILLSRI